VHLSQIGDSLDGGAGTGGHDDRGGAADGKQRDKGAGGSHTVSSPGWIKGGMIKNPTT
jgi:hypothetical protein